MNKHSTKILNFKNPSDIFKYCNNHNINNIIENNSGIWEKLIQKNYTHHMCFKHEQLCLKDYYVLLYFLRPTSNVLLTSSYLLCYTSDSLFLIYCLLVVADSFLFATCYLMLTTCLLTACFLVTCLLFACCWLVTRLLVIRLLAAWFLVTRLLLASSSLTYAC